MHELTQQMRDRRMVKAKTVYYADTAQSNAAHERAIASAYSGWERSLDLLNPVYQRNSPEANSERDRAIAIADAEHSRVSAPALAEYRRISAETEPHTHH